MSTADELLVTLLIDLVNKVPDQPKRVLFKGVSNLYPDFEERTRPEWDVRVTQAGVDVVSARNDPSIPVLVVFYRAEIRERESLNAFRLYTEDEIAKALVERLAVDGFLPESYNQDERSRLTLLLDIVYPSVEQLAKFLLAGKDSVGASLPLLGLFRDPNLRLDMPIRQWDARLRENQQTAVLRWRDFLGKGIGTRVGRQTLGDERVGLLREAEVDPAKRESVLMQVTLNDALSILNPPTRLVESIMSARFTRGQAEQLVSDLKSTQVEHREELTRLLEEKLKGLPALSDTVRQRLQALVRVTIDDDDDSGSERELDLRRVGFCLEGLLRLAREPDVAFPNRLTIKRTGRNGEYCAKVEIQDGRLNVTMDDDASRFLSVPGVSGLSELEYEVCLPNNKRYRFTLGVLPHWLEQYAEDWLDDAYWEAVKALNPEHANRWHTLHRRVQELRDIVDPDWKREQTEDEERDSEDREPNNPIYAIFDLLYLANRELFDAFLDDWLSVATLPWRETKLHEKPQEWRKAVSGLLQLGTAHPSNGKTVLFPFYPLRLAWYREVFRKIESWLAQAVENARPLVFEPGVLAEQLKPFDRPRALFNGKRRLVEATTNSFFIVQFVSELQHQHARPPLYRARQKLGQFGRMWPFSLDRLHLAFQPSDASEDIYQLLVRDADDQPNAAYRVRALVESTGSMTVFDHQLLSTSEETVDLLTQEHYESILPRVDYAKGQLVHEGGEEGSEPQAVSAHVTLLVDAFDEDRYDFGEVVGRLSKNPNWVAFGDLVQEDSASSREKLVRVDLSAPPYHTGPMEDNSRKLVFVPLSGGEPEYLRMLYDSLMAWQYHDAFNEGVYYEQVRWDVEHLDRMHDQADWVLLFDRTLDRSLFETLTPAGVKLIDYYPDLPGGYKMSVSSRRIDAVQWQLAQVLRQFFPGEELDVLGVAERMLDTLSEFASGLLLKTLGGGSLAQELLGLYATYLSLIAEGEFVPRRDWLIPLDDYQSWFGRRTQRGRRADLMVLSNPVPDALRLTAVESKWYANPVRRSFVRDEFDKDGQMRTTVTSLRSLFDPTQERLDSHYWQKMLSSLLDAAPSSWESLRQQLGTNRWHLEVDGVVYVHQYREEDIDGLRAHNEDLLAEVAACIVYPDDGPLFYLGPGFKRLRLKPRDEIVRLFAQEAEG